MTIQFQTMRRAGLLSAIVLGYVFSATTGSAQPTDTTANQLVGQWKGTTGNVDSTPASSINLLFTSNGTVIMSFDDRRALIGAKMRYTIDSTPKPMHLNFEVPSFNEPVLTIFDLVDAKTLKVQFTGTNPGAKRPTEFKNEGQFQKTSDTAIAPLTQLPQAEQTKEGEGQFLIQNLTRSALLYNLETNQFPTTLEQLGLSSNTTQNYRLQLSTKDNQLTLLARPKKEGFTSFISVILRQKIEKPGQMPELAMAITCQSVRPSLIAPPMPKIAPDPMYFNPYSLQCNSGSKAVSFE